MKKCSLFAVVVSAVLIAVMARGALGTFGGGVELPPSPTHVNAGPSTAALLLDADGESLAFVFQAPRAMTVRKIWFRTGTVTTGATVDCRVETVSLTDGNPSGTLWAVTTSAESVIGNGDDDVMLASGNLTNDAVVAQGDLLSVVIRSRAGGNLNLTTYPEELHPGLPYSVHFAAGAWTKDDNATYFALELSDGSLFSLGGGWHPHETAAITSYNTGSTPDERALNFRFPFKYRVTGFWAWVEMDGDGEFVLYQDGTAVATNSIDADIGITTASERYIGYFPLNVTFNANQEGKVSFRPSTVTSAGLVRLTMDSAALMAAYSGGTNCFESHRSDGGAWTDDTTVRPMLGLIVDQFDDAAQAGGGGTSSATYAQ